MGREMGDIEHITDHRAQYGRRLLVREQVKPPILPIPDARREAEALLSGQEPPLRRPFWSV
jgi:hypothetical protein